MNSVITEKLCLPQGQPTNATYGVVILNNKSFAALQHFVQIIQVLRNNHHKDKVLHLLWDEILTLACIFFMKFSISSRK